MKDEVVLVTELASEYRRFPVPTLRDLIYHAEPRLTARGETIPPNGFGSCIVRVGRRVELTVEAPSEEDAMATVDRLASSLLSNPLIEAYTIELLGGIAEPATAGARR